MAGRAGLKRGADAATLAAMHFSLIDRVVSVDGPRLVGLKHVTQAEEYLRDHFPGFPVLPGVFMLECMVQAARLLEERERGPSALPLVLGGVRGLKYGRFVTPGSTLLVEVERTGAEGGQVHFKGTARLAGEEGGNGGAEGVAASGRLWLREVRAASAERVG